MASKRPNPDRFLEFEEFRDQTGFTIYEDGHHIDFYYDNFGGWFDEYGNYFNQNGQPTRPSQASLKFWDSIKYKYQEDDDIDDILNSYNQGSYESDEDDNLHEIEREYAQKAYIEKQKKRLRHYGDNEEIQIRFTLRKKFIQESLIVKALGQQNVKLVKLDEKFGNSQKVTGTIIAFNKKCAEAIIQLHNSEVNYGQIEFVVDALDIDDSDEEVMGIQTDDPLLKQTQQHVPQQQQQQQQSQQQSLQKVQQEPVQQQQQQFQQQQQQQQQQQSQQQQESEQFAKKQIEQVWVYEYLILEGFPEKEIEENIKQWIRSKIINNQYQLSDDKFEFKQRTKKEKDGKTDTFQCVKLDLGSKERIEKASQSLSTHNMYQGKRKIHFSIFKPNNK